MQQLKPIRATLLGEQTAENDIKLLLPNFIETPEYRSIIETKDSTVVVGRRGTGRALSRQPQAAAAVEPRQGLRPRG